VTRSFTAHWLGRVPYGQAHALQERLLAARVKKEIGDTLLLLEHDPVVTLGRGAHAENILFSRDDLARRGVEVHETGRGGDVTYHGPGQLVAYPIFDLHPDRLDVRRYVRDLARVMIDLSRAHGVDASFLEGDAKLVGVWVDAASPARWPGDPRVGDADGEAERERAAEPAKIGAIGVKLSRWVTMHGFAFNVTTDLDAFRLIVPCGITAYGVTSLAALGALGAPGAPGVVDGAAATVEGVAREAVAAFERVFDARGRMGDEADRAALLG
jgi:lipoyl(octanoyl) transferase